MPGTRTEPSRTLWACSDCFILHCNGESPASLTDDELADWLERYERGTRDADVTAGMLTEEHSCLDDAGNRAEECDCETLDFSWSPCALCGSNLGGSRHAVTLWFEPAPIVKAIPNSPLYATMRQGHILRTGHALQGRLVSVDNGQTWSLDRACCRRSAQHDTHGHDGDGRCITLSTDGHVRSL